MKALVVLALALSSCSHPAAATNTYVQMQYNNYFDSAYVAVAGSTQYVPIGKGLFLLKHTWQAFVSAGDRSNSVQQWHSPDCPSKACAVKALLDYEREMLK